MSFQAMSWAVVQPVSSPAAKLVLLMLANHSNGHTGQCNPSHQRLADECSMSRSSLKTHLANLAEAGYIRIEHRTQDGCSLPNSYVILTDGVGQNLAEGGSKSDRGVGQNLAEGGSKSGYKPGSEPGSVNQEVNQNLYVAHPDGLHDGQKATAPAGRTPKARPHRFDEDDRVLASRLLELVREVAPSARPNLDAWANDLRLMRERDGRSLADIEAMFAWAHTDAFWRQNILSPTNLREKWPKLEAKRGGAAAAYRPDETAVMEAYNAALTPKGWPEAVTKPYCPKRAGAIREFLGFSSAPEWMGRYFGYLSHNLPAKPGFGFDWVIRRDTYIRAKEGNFRVLAAVA